MKIQATPKNVAITEKSLKLYMTNQIYRLGAFTYKTISDVDFTDEPVVQFNVPVLEKTFIHN